jgi:hypothetical protein
MTAALRSSAADSGTSTGIAQGSAFDSEISVHKDPATKDILKVVLVPLGAVLPPGLRIYTSQTAFIPLEFQIC